MELGFSKKVISDHNGNLRNCKKWNYLSSTSIARFNCERNDIESYLCRYCNFTTTHLVIFKYHVKNCHKQGEEYTVKSYICKYCTFETCSILFWLKHEHCDYKYAKYFKCLHCMFSSKYRYSLQRHNTIRHTNEEINWFKCEQYIFVKTKCMLQRSDNGKRKKKLQCFKCEHCYYECMSKTTLIRHIRCGHPEIKWFKCGQCPYKSVFKKDFLIHFESRHTDAHWFKCEQCRYQSKTRGKWIAHIRSKHVETYWFKYEQGDCKSKLKRKLRVCDRNKAVEELFKCAKCSFVCKFEGNLKIHMSRAHQSEVK